MVVFKFTLHIWTPKIDQWSVTDGFAKKLQPPFNIHVEKCSEKVDIYIDLTTAFIALFVFTD